MGRDQLVIDVRRGLLRRLGREAYSKWKKLGKKAKSSRNRRRTVVVSDEVAVVARGGIY
jgi:hypothetical protein